VSRRTLVAGAVLALLVLVVGLAAGGVFSGGTKRPAATTTTVPSDTTTQSVTPPATSLQAPKTTLKPGDAGAQVRVLQRALAHLGYSPGTVDGQYGAATVRAVSNFQRAHKLTVDGIVGPATLAALASALTARG
jgi:peptidoglycan hydrolase-like protein with peptidoglycan-binding domain